MKKPQARRVRHTSRRCSCRVDSVPRPCVSRLREPPSGLMPAASAIASSTVDLPVPFSPTKQTTDASRSTDRASAQPAARTGRHRGRAPRPRAVVPRSARRATGPWRQSVPAVVAERPADPASPAIRPGPCGGRPLQPRSVRATPTSPSPTRRSISCSWKAARPTLNHLGVEVGATGEVLGARSRRGSGARRRCSGRPGRREPSRLKRH